MSSLQLPRQTVRIRRRQRSPSQIVKRRAIVVSPHTLQRANVIEVPAREELGVGIASEAVDDAVYARLLGLLVVVWFPHAVGAPVGQGLFLDLVVSKGVQFDVLRRRHCPARSPLSADGAGRQQSIRIAARMRLRSKLISEPLSPPSSVLLVLFVNVFRVELSSLCGIEAGGGESVPSNLGGRLGTIIRLAEPGSSWLRCHAGAAPRKRKEKKVPASHARGCRHQELLQGLSQPQGHVEVGGVFCDNRKKQCRRKQRRSVREL